jgi:sarcosine oxidase
MPTLPGELVRAVTCMYTTTPDEHFVIARHPGHPQVTIAAGFSGHGFKFVPVVGEVLADLTIDDKTALPIGLFGPRRLTGPTAAIVTGLPMAASPDRT